MRQDISCVGKVGRIVCGHTTRTSVPGYSETRLFLLGASSFPVGGMHV